MPRPKDRPVHLGNNKWQLVGGQVITNVHISGQCSPQHCCVHNPSDHHMSTWRQNYRTDRGLMERICEHGCGHPDPDDPTTDRRHGCCGCCHPPEIDPAVVQEAIEETRRWVAE